MRHDSLTPGRVKEYTQAKRDTYVVLTVTGFVGSLIAIGVGGTGSLVILFIVIAFLAIIYAIRSRKLARVQRAYAEMLKMPRHGVFVGYKGICTYFKTEIVLKLNQVSESCKAYYKRIVIRSS